MNREALEALDKDTLIRLVLAQAETMAALTKHVETLTARVAERETRLGLPPKTPDNSSLPPSKGQKPPEPATPKPKAEPHPGAHRTWHPNPTSRRECRAESRQRCGADVSDTMQFACESYDPHEIPQITPDVMSATIPK